MSDSIPVGRATPGSAQSLDIAPANWIWVPSERTLPNTVALFRREFELESSAQAALLWIAADSRYRLWIDGAWVAWGPAPCDPRELEIDPIDVTDYLDAGPHVIAVEVLYYGRPEGTWPGGKPGLACHLDIETTRNDEHRIVTDEEWLCRFDGAHPVGQHRRWYLRSLQEVYDARERPAGWRAPGFVHGDGEESFTTWLSPMLLDCPTDAPPCCSNYPGPPGFDGPDSSDAHLRSRDIPHVETAIERASIMAAGTVTWHRHPDDWFSTRVPDSLTAEVDDAVITETDTDTWTLDVPADPHMAAFCTFAFDEQLIGWPRFEIDAPAGTTVELIVQEAHDPDGPAWLDSGQYEWTRIHCEEGTTTFESLDYESLRWLQLHVRDVDGPVTLRNVGVRRRQPSTPEDLHVELAEEPLQRLVDACGNTIANAAQETIVDGMGRERQQYCGDIGHLTHALRFGYGDRALTKRYIRTYGMGISADGYFLDSWPAGDRLYRIPYRHFDWTEWGPILDHGVQYAFECFHHYQHTGTLDTIRTVYPNLRRFGTYLADLRTDDGLLPVDDLGVPYVWMDTDAYDQQRHKQCPFTLYAAAGFEHALAPLARALDDDRYAEEFKTIGQELRDAAVEHFWSDSRGIFVSNLPWIDEANDPYLDARTLSGSLLWDQCPDEDTSATVAALAEPANTVRLCFPPNAIWRHWALARNGRMDVVIEECRNRWSTLPSVLENNTLQEHWDIQPDSDHQWSHASVAPLLVLLTDGIGVTPAEPGFERVEWRPRLARLPATAITTNTPKGPFSMTADPVGEGYELALSAPAGITGELVLPSGSEADLPEVPSHDDETVRFSLDGGQCDAIFRRDR